MKKKWLVLSLLANLALLTFLVMAHAIHQEQLREFARGAMHSDEIHLALHAQALAALEASDPAGAEATAETLRKVVEAGALNIEARRQAELGR